MFRLSPVLLPLCTYLLYPSTILTIVLYFYPLFFGCEFSPARPSLTAAAPNSTLANSQSPKPTLAPFRLLAFGDPQLEGDTSLPDYTSLAYFPSFSRLRRLDYNAHWTYNRNVLENFYHDVFKEDLPTLLWSFRKRLDLLGNDFYLAHQYRTLHWWLAPTHVAVLGDLLGSQWISDAEFSDRATRFWSRVFRTGRRVENAITNRGWTEELGSDSEGWRRRIINVPGNHDVGYAGDLTPERFSRYEREFGNTNWDITFSLPSDSAKAQDAHDIPSIRIVTLNSMNLDGPALSPSLQADTYSYMNDIVSRSHSSSSPFSANKTFTLLLTHIPLPKPSGVCVDSELFNYYTDEDVGSLGGGALREQNHLSAPAARPLLEGILGLKSNPMSNQMVKGKGIILTGHDHEGCDTYHYVNLTAPRDGSEWTAAPFAHPQAKAVRDTDDVPGVREVTLRSMMGEFGGHAALLSAWWDDGEGWRVEVESCDLGVQHWWWAVHVLDLLVALGFALGVTSWVGEKVGDYRRRKKMEREREKRRRLEKRRRSKSRSKSKSKSLSSTPSASGKTNGSVKTPQSGVVKRRGNIREADEDTNISSGRRR